MKKTAALLVEKWGDKIEITPTKDEGTTGNFEIKVKDELVHSKKTMGHGFAYKSEDEMKNVNAAIEKALG